MRLLDLLFAGAMLAMSGTSALADSNPSRYEVLAGLAGVETKDGVLVRKLMAPISFAMGPAGGKDARYASDVAFFKGLDGEVRTFLKETLGDRYTTDANSRPINVIVLFPDSQENGDDAWLDKMFVFGDGVVRDRKQGDYYLMECRDLVQNLEDPYNDQTPPEDQWSVEMSAALNVELTVRGANYDRDAVTRCLYRHILAGLGLRGEVPPGQDSVLAKEYPAVRPTEFDRWMVETLYRSDEPAGAKVEVAFPELSKPTP